MIRKQPTKHQATMKFTSTLNLKNTMNIPQMNHIGNELTNKELKLYTYPMRITESFFSFFSFSLFLQHDFFLLVFFFFYFFSSFLFFSVLGNETKIAIIERYRITNYQLTTKYIYTHNPSKRELKQMFNIINPLTNQHTNATLKLNYP